MGATLGEAAAGTVTKSGAPRQIAWEAAGLRWLADAGAVAVVPVVATQEGRLDLRRVQEIAPAPAAAEALGRGLAALHGAGAPAFAAGPDGWAGDGYLGPSTDLLPLPLRSAPRWGMGYAAQLRSIAAVAERRGRLPHEDAALVRRLCDRLETGDLDDDAAPARVHGDLWAGNVLWSREGAVLIDPAAHGGHPVLDLAMLDLFGAPHLDRITAAYAEVAGWSDDWRSRMSLHQVLHLLVHVACFGGAYLPQARAAVRPWL